MISRADAMKDGTNFGAEDKDSVLLYSQAFEQAQSSSYKYLVLGICGIVFASISAPGSSLLQAQHLITCNLMMNHDQQMKINLYTFIALISGSLLISVPSDLASRLKPLVVSLVFYGLATLGLGFCTEYYCFAFVSVFRAFWVSALLTSTTVYVAEIQTPRYRGPSLCCLQIFWLVGLVAMPVLSIPWRISQFIAGTMALVVAILAARFFAESPRLLLSLGKNEEAIKSLRKIYSTNFRSRKEMEYPVKNLIDDFSPEAQNHTKLRTYVPRAMRPPWYCPLVVLQIQFVFNLCYFTMSYWFREMAIRHVPIFPIKPGQIECKLGEKYLPWGLRVDKNHESSMTSNLSCNSDDISSDYYKEVSLVAFATVPIIIWMILRLDHFGRSYFTTLSHVVAGLLSFCVHFLIGTKYDLIYTCLMESTWIVTSTVSSCLVTEIFKTRTRVLGVGLANSFGYIGMAMGMYGVLLNGGGSCILVISMTGILVTAAGLMTLSLPDTVGIYHK